MPRDFHTCVERLFQEALDLPRCDRAAYLAKTCEGDEHLRDTVQTLLDSLDRAEAGGALERPAMSGLIDQLITETSLDRYRLMERIGVGGMGVVYKASRADDEFSKLVAVKIVMVPDDEIVTLFRRERQLLASLEHPNIARLLDGGTSADGPPFLVMEYVDGVRLDRYVAASALPLRDKLVLFRKICAAVSYAHRNLIVHRDLKPANILVTADCEPKLLDFGIAKLLDPAAERTKTGRAAMTPQYASPEQLRGGAITTATDVYSLGVILYELLAGSGPYGATESDLDLTEAIVNQPPQPLGPSFHADLQNIVQMALRKEPERRYASVEQFSEDIRRYLEGYPVLARPATRVYVLRKLAGRHRATVLVAALLLVTIAAGVGATLRQAHIANQRFNDARQMAHAFLFDYHDAIVTLPGAVTLRQKLVKDGLVYLDRLSAQAAGDAGLQLELAGGYMKVADVQGSANGSNLGDVRGSLISYQKAIALLEELNRREPANQEVQELLGMADRFYGQLSQQAGDPRTAADRVRKGIALFEALCAGGQYKMKQTLYSGSRYIGMDDRRNVLSGSYTAMGRVAGDPSVPNLGDPREAERWYRKNLAFLESLPPDKARLGAIGFNHGYIATLKAYAADYPGELAEMRKVLEIKLRVMQMPPVTQYDRRELAIAYSNLGVGLLDNHDFESALENFHVAGRLFESLVAADPDNAEIRTTMTNNTRRIAETLGKLKRYAEASATYQRVIGTYRDLAGKDPGNAALQARLGQAYIGLSVMQSTAGNGPAAVQAAGQAEKIFEPLGAADPASHQLLARAYFQSGKGEELSGNWAAARGWYRRSLDLWRELQSKGRLPASNAPLLMRTEEALAVSEKKLAAAAQTAR